MNTDLMFSSKTDLWETPQSLFDELNSKYNFTLDVCANSENAKCDKFFSEQQDGLSQVWKGTCWMNPPYGRQIGKWVRKAYLSNLDPHLKTTVVCLLPARTDTKWFHDYIYTNPNATVTLLKGRLKFGGHKNSAPFPSMIVTFKHRPE